MERSKTFISLDLEEEEYENLIEAMELLWDSRDRQDEEVIIRLVESFNNVIDRNGDGDGDYIEMN